MTPREIASALSGRANDMGLTAAAIARKCALPTRHVRDVLRAAPDCRLLAACKVANALGFVVVSIPLPLAPVLAAGHEVTEPCVLTKVQRALASIDQGRTVLFLKSRPSD